MSILSVVVPVFNEEASIEAFLSRVRPILDAQGLSGYEIIFVNDGSRDATLSRLEAEARADSRIRIIDLSRNFGKEAALTAGIDHAAGNAVIPIDVDLQDPPELIPEMLARWRQGYDVVLASRNDRSSDTWFKRVTASLFYRTMLRLSDVEIPPQTGDFRLMDRRVVETLKLMPERTRFMKGVFAWVGFRTTTIYFKRERRLAGEPQQKLGKLIRLAVDGIVSFTSLPLRIWSVVGALAAALGLVYMTFIVVRTLIFGIDLPGYASLLVVMLFFSGLILLSIGVLGEYIARIFVEVKQRPLYIVRETTNLGADAEHRRQVAGHRE
ncbi:glycosyltransferase family 2 protein [Arvimicrobium flavum]|uniref:glycosyltransferase family 2 protein n=1 Tax=Arvimicrobium flavum TaxID=3393320 RepID=UPI00237C1B6C|nr:glycosyltransferase family 2 protein [Mesorhizobium shangrilense]